MLWTLVISNNAIFLKSKPNKQLFVLRMVSAVQALFCCLTGLTVCCYSCTRNMLRTSHYISEAYAWFGAAYFLYDIWSMYVVHVSVPVLQENGDAVRVKQNSRTILRFFDYLIKNPIIVIHHVFIGGFGFLFITVNILFSYFSKYNKLFFFSVFKRWSW